MKYIFFLIFLISSNMAFCQDDSEQSSQCLKEAKARDVSPVERMQFFNQCITGNPTFRSTVTSTRDGVTTVTTYESGIEVDSIVTVEQPFVPSEMTRKLVGNDFKWSQFSNSQARKASSCLDSGQCDPEAFIAINSVNDFLPTTLGMSRCVAQRQCDLNAYLLVYEVTGFSPHAEEMSRCVKEDLCDLEAYLAVYGATEFNSTSFDVAMCVASNTCSLITFLDVYRQTEFASHSLEIAQCTAQQLCDPNIYLQYVKSNHLHDQALQLAREQFQQNDEGTGNSGTDFVTE